MSPARDLRVSAAAGALVWLALGLAPLSSGGDPIARVLLFGALVVTPLTLSLLPPLGPGSDAWARWHAATVLAQPIGALGLVSALLAPVGPLAGALACTWASFTLFGAALAVVRLRDGGLRELGFAVGLAMFPVSGAWLVASRLGVRLLGFDAVIVVLTATHFQYIGLALPALVALSQRRSGSRAIALALAALVVSIVLVAIGLTVSPALATLGSALLTLALVVHSAVALRSVVPTLTGRAAKIAMTISLLAPLASMPLAIAWSAVILDPSLGPALPIPLDIDAMLRLHGRTNAYLLVTLGLIAWTLDARAARAHTAS